MSYSSIADNCVDGADQMDSEILNPKTNQVITFNCKNPSRREFIRISEETGEKFVATAFKNLDEQTGEEKLSLNTLYKYQEDQATEFLKFDPSGKLERMEKYLNGKVVFKYIEKAQRLEEFNFESKIEGELTRECYYDFDTQQIRESKIDGIKIQTSLKIKEIINDHLKALNVTKISSNKIELVSQGEKNEKLFSLQEYRIETCLERSFIPLAIKGEVKFDKKLYIIKDEGIFISALLPLIKNNDKKNLRLLLEINAREIRDINKDQNESNSLPQSPSVTQ